MAYSLLIYYALSLLVNVSIGAVFYLAYLPEAGRALRRWFLILVANAAAIAGALSIEVLARTGGGDLPQRVLRLSRSAVICLNAFLVPYFVHTFLPPTVAGPANGCAAAAAFAAAILENAGLPRLTGIVIAVALLYGLVLALILRLRKTTAAQEPDGWVLHSVLVISACFFPGLLLNTLAGYGIIVWPAAERLLRIDITPVYLAVAGYVLLRRTRALPARLAARGVRVPERLLAELSLREREVVDQILQGRTNREIAEALYIAESTVKKHVNSAFRKLRISSRWQLLKLQRNAE